MLRPQNYQEHNHQSEKIGWMNKKKSNKESIVILNQMSNTRQHNCQNRISVVLGYFPVPENRTHGKKYYRTGPGTARKSMQVLEPDPEPPGGSSQF